MSKDQITMYGADWCGDCRRSKRLFEELDVQVNHIDVEADKSAAAKVLLPSSSTVMALLVPVGVDF